MGAAADWMRAPAALARDHHHLGVAKVPGEGRREGGGDAAVSCQLVHLLRRTAHAAAAASKFGQRREAVQTPPHGSDGRVPRSRATKKPAFIDGVRLVCRLAMETAHGAFSALGEYEGVCSFSSHSSLGEIDKQAPEFRRLLRLRNAGAAFSDRRRLRPRRSHLAVRPARPCVCRPATRSSRNRWPSCPSLGDGGGPHFSRPLAAREPRPWRARRHRFQHADRARSGRRLRRGEAVASADGSIDLVDGSTRMDVRGCCAAVAQR